MAETMETFRPGKGAVEVRFIRGEDGMTPLPPIVSQAQFSERFAVVQETYVEGCVDMYFDQALWRALAGYVAGLGGTVSVLIKFKDRREAPLDDFLEGWETVPDEDKNPPWVLLARAEGRLVLAMVTDYWVQVGGPKLYHDSYTYSLFSDRRLEGEVMAALVRAAGSTAWRLASEVVDIPPGSKHTPGPASRLLSWLRTWL